MTDQGDEQQAADILGIPFETVTQGALIPVAYSTGVDFRPGQRQPLDTVLHLDQW